MSTRGTELVLRTYIFSRGKRLRNCARFRWKLFEIQTDFSTTDLTNLPKYHIYLKLMIDGAVSKPFFFQCGNHAITPLIQLELTNGRATPLTRQCLITMGAHTVFSFPSMAHRWDFLSITLPQTSQHLLLENHKTRPVNTSPMDAKARVATMPIMG
jgi:hypothetical protein